MKKLISKLISAKTSNQYWAITVNYTDVDDLLDGTYEIVAVSVYNGDKFVADITDILSDLNLLEKIVTDIDWYQEYREQQSDRLEQDAFDNIKDREAI